MIGAECKSIHNGGFLYLAMASAIPSNSKYESICLLRIIHFPANLRFATKMAYF